jgi:hypothetical protein
MCCLVVARYDFIFIYKMIVHTHYFMLRGSSAPLPSTVITPHHDLEPGSLLQLEPRVRPDHGVHHLQTASPPARASVRVAVVDSQRDGREGEPSGEGEKE